MSNEKQKKQLLEKLAYEYRTKVNTKMNQSEARERIARTFRENDNRKNRG